jgi:SAM-dependent methyltransferase
MTTDLPDLPSSPACLRNRGPILDRLRTALAGVHRVLEIGSGTGEHATHFARALHHLTWQPTDVPPALGIVRARAAVEGTANLLAPLELDVKRRPWNVGRYDGLYTANTLHIVDRAAVEAFFGGAGEVLDAGGTLCVYGPFRYGGAHTSPSNAEFDAQLRERDPASGVRDVEWILELAGAQRLALVVDHAMPANNRMLHFRKSV